MDMQQVIITTSIVFIIILFIITLLIKKWLSDISNKSAQSEELIAWLKSTNTRMDEQGKLIFRSLQQNSHTLNERLDNAARVISSVQKNIGEITEIGRNMKDLQEFLNSPKLRGNIGEQILKELLGQILPKQLFHLQYAFKSGTVVDAVIKTSNGIIPIDSKFPMENFRKFIENNSQLEKDTAKKDFVKDVKKHVDDISKKYIVQDEGTIDYALMYIPSEAVYYEIINDTQLFEYCNSMRILPVSPMTLYAYLRSILISFESQKIEKKAHEILRTISAVKKNYSKVEENLTTLSRHIINSYNMMNQTLTSFSQLGQKISQTNQLQDEN